MAKKKKKKKKSTCTGIIELVLEVSYIRDIEYPINTFRLTDKLVT